MKTLPKMEISDHLDTLINDGVKASGLCKSDVIRLALHIGPPQFAARFQPPPLWLQERIREALTEPAERISHRQFDETMTAIANLKASRHQRSARSTGGHSKLVRVAGLAPATFPS